MQRYFLDPIFPRHRTLNSLQAILYLQGSINFYRGVIVGYSGAGEAVFPPQTNRTGINKFWIRIRICVIKKPLPLSKSYSAFLDKNWIRIKRKTLSECDPSEKYGHWYKI